MASRSQIISTWASAVIASTAKATAATKLVSGTIVTDTMRGGAGGEVGK